MFFHCPSPLGEGARRADEVEREDAEGRWVRLMKTLVLGASTNTSRYSYKAMNLLRAYKHEVLGVGRDLGKVGDVEVKSDFPQDKDIDTVTMYLNPMHQKQYYDKIIAAKPRRIIFNPGAENDELADLAEKNGIKTEEACTLVLLNTGQY